MPISSRASIVVAACLLASPLFRPLHASQTWRIASVRPPDPEAPRAVARTGQVIVQFRSDTGERDVARVTRQAGGERGRPGGLREPDPGTLDGGLTTAEADRRPCGP